MRSRAFLPSVAAAIVASFSSLPAYAQTAPAYIVAPVRSELAASADVGKRRAGVLCAPAGKLRWSDLAPDAEHAATLVARTFREAGMDAETPAYDRLGRDAGASTTRILADVVALDLSLCVKQSGLARLVDSRRAARGRGVITVRWRTYDAGTRRLLSTREICPRFKVDGDALTPGLLLDQAFAEAAREFARTREDQTAPATCAATKGERVDERAIAASNPDS